MVVRCVQHTYVINGVEVISTCNSHDGEVPKVLVKESKGLKDNDGAQQFVYHPHALHSSH